MKLCLATLLVFAFNTPRLLAAPEAPHTWQPLREIDARYEVRLFSRATTKNDEPMVGFKVEFDEKGKTRESKQSKYILKSASTTIENYVFVLGVTQKTPDGLRYRLTLRDWRMNLSEKQDGKATKQWFSWNNAVAPTSGVVNGSSFTFLLKANSEVSDMRGLDLIRKKLTDAAKLRHNDELANVADRRFSEIFWQNTLHQLMEGANATRIETGKIWKFSRPASMFSPFPLEISREVTDVSPTSATLRDTATLKSDTTPNKTQNYRDTAIYCWNMNGAYTNDWKLDWSKNWSLQSSGKFQGQGHSLIYVASKKGELALVSDTPTSWLEETRTVATRLP